MYRLKKDSINIINTIILNIKLFPFKVAIKLPIKVLNRIDISNLKRGSVAIEGEIRRFMIVLGGNGTEGINERRRNFLRIDNGGKLILKGSANFAEGISIRISKNGKLIIGNNFTCNKNCFISCDDIVEIGNNVLLGWNVNIRDSDGHEIYDLLSKEKNISVKKVDIGNSVWIGANVHILKGSIIRDESVVAYNSCVLSQFNETNCIIGGYPAKILRRNIEWKR